MNIIFEYVNFQRCLREHRHFSIEFPFIPNDILDKMNKIEKTILKPNLVIKRNKTDYNWKIVEELGAGGFGTVSKVVQVDDRGYLLNLKEYAMKTEYKDISKQASRLKIEKDVMASFQKCEEQYKKHFPELIDMGQTVSLKWIVMSLVGPSLEKLYKKKRFSISTTLQVSLQALKGISDFHLVGFLHRDIKPGNYCIGDSSKNNIVYIIDFGLARKYRTKTNGIRPPRPKTKMVGTPRYCPRASHMLMELGRKDDFESWFYMLMGFIDEEKALPWKGKKKQEALEMKNRVFSEPKWIPSISKVPPQFIVMMEYLDKLQFASNVEFGIFRETITDYARSLHLTLNEKLDWLEEVDDQRTMEKTATTTSMITKTEADNRSVSSDLTEERSSAGDRSQTSSLISRKPSISKRKQTTMRARVSK